MVKVLIIIVSSECFHQGNFISKYHKIFTDDLPKQNTGCNCKTTGLVACTCIPATLEAELQNGVSWIPVGGNSPSIGG